MVEPRTFRTRARWLGPVIAAVAASTSIGAAAIAVDQHSSRAASDPAPAGAGRGLEIATLGFLHDELRLRVTNPLSEPRRLAIVTVNEAVVPFVVAGPRTLGHGAEVTVRIPYHWIEGDTYGVSVISSDGYVAESEAVAE